MDREIPKTHVNVQPKDSLKKQYKRILKYKQRKRISRT